MKDYVVKEDLKGIRLDKCIVSLDNEISRETAQRLITEGNILVNRKEQKVSYKVLNFLSKRSLESSDIISKQISNIFCLSSKSK